MTKIKTPGPGRGLLTPNAKSRFVRDERFQARATEGLNKTISALIKETGYKTPSDVLHEAVLRMGNQVLTKKRDLFWLKKIK